MTGGWRKPYRSMDASGSPGSAGAVARAWIDAQAEKAVQIYGAELCSIDCHNVEGGGSVTVLYAQRRPIAVATIFRDDMNFSQLVRWVG